MSTPPTTIDARRRKALYRANYRGTKEMDWLLGKYADAQVPAMDEASLSQFERLLELQDPDLNLWLLNPARVPDPQFTPLIDAIRRFHALDKTLDHPMTGAER